jgi:hypothetical protein
MYFCIFGNNVILKYKLNILLDELKKQIPSIIFHFYIF